MCLALLCIESSLKGGGFRRPDTVAHQQCPPSASAGWPTGLTVDRLIRDGFFAPSAWRPGCSKPRGAVLLAVSDVIWAGVIGAGAALLGGVVAGYVTLRVSRSEREDRAKENNLDRAHGSEVARADRLFDARLAPYHDMSRDLERTRESATLILPPIKTAGMLEAPEPPLRRSGGRFVIASPSAPPARCSMPLTGCAARAWRSWCRCTPPRSSNMLRETGRTAQPAGPSNLFERRRWRRSTRPEGSCATSCAGSEAW